MLFHAFQHGSQSIIGLVGRDTELVERLAVRVIDIFGSGQHRTNHGRDFDNGCETLLDGQSAYHSVLRAVLAHVGEVVKQKCITDRAGCEGNDVFALFFLEAENQISTLSHRSGESAGSESAWFNVDAGHKSGTGRIHLASRKATRTGARNLHSGASEVASEQEFAHRRPADIACTDEHDMHTAHPFVSLPNLWKLQSSILPQA